MGKFGIGIIGAGAALRPHALALKDLEERVSVRGIFSRDVVKRELAAETYGFMPVGSVTALLDDPDTHAIVLLTPPNARVELVEAIAKSGRHILMEKPVERTTGAARAIVEFCDECDVRLGVIFQHRFREASLKAREILQSGVLGEMAAVSLQVPWWRSNAYYSEPGRGTYAQDGGGVLITQAIHSLDLMLSLTGPVVEVQAIAGTSKLHDIEVEDFVGAGVTFANGAIGSIMTTTTTFPGGQETIVFDCMRATAILAGNVLTVNWHDGRVEKYGKPEPTGAGDNRMAFPHDWHRAQIAEFIDAVKARRDPMSNGRTALQVHRLIDALLQSSREGKRIAVRV